MKFYGYIYLGVLSLKMKIFLPIENIFLTVHSFGQNVYYRRGPI
jgi:hypothetical protein